MTTGHVSIHDVAPETLGKVQHMLEVLTQWGLNRVMLLVIPGRPWSEGQLNILRGMAAHGHVLAGHGWLHEVTQPKTLYHQLHRALISRNVAEHLSRTEDQVLDLLRENHAWFSQQGLPEPTHYVPPAWALGNISRDRLKELPFETVEVLQGVIESATGVLHRMPLLGYEADTPFRAWFLQQFNRLNTAWARRTGRCIRFSLHPYDFDYLLKDRIEADCSAFQMCANVRLPVLHEAVS